MTASSPSDGEYSPSVGEVAVTHDADSGTPAISIGDLQALMTAGMPPLCSKRVGYWTLRSANGYTGRANSALLIGDPGLPAEDGIEQVRTWYADQGLPALIQLPHTLGLDPAESDLGSLLAQRNWQFFMRTFVLTRASTPHPLPEGTTVQSYDEPPADWWLTASPRALEHRETLTAMLAMIPDGAYLTAYQNGIALGHARLAFSEGWSGVFDVHTVPDARRRGVARALMSRAELTAYDRRIPLQYLQVAADNDAAVRLYESLGWQVHHEYHYAALRR